MNWYSVTSYCSTEEAELHYAHIVHATSKVHAITKHLHCLVSMGMGLSESLTSMNVHGVPEWVGVKEQFCQLVDGKMMEV